MRYVSGVGCATIEGATAYDLTAATIGTPSLAAPEQLGPRHPDADQRCASMDDFVVAWDSLARRGALKTPTTLIEKVVAGEVVFGLFAAVVVDSALLSE